MNDGSRGRVDAFHVHLNTRGVSDEITFFSWSVIHYKPFLTRRQKAIVATSKVSGRPGVFNVKNGSRTVWILWATPFGWEGAREEAAKDNPNDNSNTRTTGVELVGWGHHSEALSDQLRLCFPNSAFSNVVLGRCCSEPGSSMRWCCHCYLENYYN